jgi:hypothetical protein
VNQVVEEIKRLYLQLAKEQKIEIVRFAILKMPPGMKLRNLFNEKELSRIEGFDLDLIGGQIGEMAFLNIATSGKHEVKRDYEVSSTGKPSCLSTTQSPFWVYWLSGEQYGDEVAIVITAARLRKLTEIGYLTFGGDGKKSLLSIFDVRDLLRPNDWIEKRLTKKARGNQVSLF